jgi:hypothetical protein
MWTDIGNGAQKILMRSDGTYWRPMNGSAVLWSRAGSVNTPIASLTGTAAAQNFVLPDTLQIPVGLLFPNCRLIVSARIGRNNVIGTTTSARIRFGTANSTADTHIAFNSLSASASTQWDALAELLVRSTTSQHRTLSGTRFSTGAFLFDTAEVALDLTTLPYYVSIGLESSFASPDVVSLYGYQVTISG